MMTKIKEMVVVVVVLTVADVSNWKRGTTLFSNFCLVIKNIVINEKMKGAKSENNSL